MNKYQVYWHRVLQLYIHQDETFCPLLLARYNFKWMGKGNAKKDLRCHLWIKFIFSHLLRTISSHLHIYCINLFQVYPCHAHFLNITLQYHLRVHRVGEGAGKERKERMPRKHSRVFIELLFSAVLGICTEVSGLSLQPPTRSASLLLLSSRSQRLSKWQIQDPKTNTRSWWLFKVTCSRW